MALQFHHTLERLEIWSAAADGFSFVISYETRSGTGFHGRPGFMATWRPLDKNNFAIRISRHALRDICRCRGSLQRHAKTSNGTRGREAVGALRAHAFCGGSDQKCSRRDWSICWAMYPPTQGRTATTHQVRVPLIYINRSTWVGPLRRKPLQGSENSLSCRSSDFAGMIGS